MAIIDFQDAAWDSVVNAELCHTGGANGNGLADPLGSGTILFLAAGSGFLQQDRRFFFSSFNCQDARPGPAVLVIRFQQPQQLVRFLHTHDLSGPSPTSRVEFFADHGGVNQCGPTLLDAIGTVEYSSAAEPIKEVVVIAGALENTIDNIEFFQTIPVLTHDVALAIDGSGSMALERRWESAIEASDIFADVYAAIAAPSNTLGAVLFRWTCGAQSGDLTTVNPPLTALSAGVDIPALYAAEAPAQCTPIGEGLVRAGNLVQGGSNDRGHVLLLTDGINNSGRSVLAASADASLAGVTVHTIGVGAAENIDALAVTQVAQQHQGSFRQTTDPSEVLDFFVQILDEMLGKAAPALLNVDTATIANLTTRAVFLVAWSDPAVSNDFDLRAPDGTLIDHAAPVGPAGTNVVYHPGGGGSAHAYFVVDGANLAGDWQYVNVPAGTRKIAIEDLDLKISWAVHPLHAFAGEPFRLTVRITQGGKPFRGSADVSVSVRGPAESQADVLVKGLRRVKGKQRSRPDQNVRSQSVAAALKAMGKKRLSIVEAGAVTLAETHPGVYEGEFTDTHNDGIYNFSFSARGEGTKKRRFARRFDLAAVAVPRPDGGASDLRVKKLGNGMHRATVTPRTAKGTFVGPFLSNSLRIDAVGARAVGPVRERGGTYTQVFSVDGKGTPRFGLSLLGASVTLRETATKSPRSKSRK